MDEEELLRAAESQAAAFNEINAERDTSDEQEHDDGHSDKSKAAKDPATPQCSSSESLGHDISCRQTKLKLLVRSHAIREAASPPPDPLLGPERVAKFSDGRPSSKLEGPANDRNDRNTPSEVTSGHDYIESSFWKLLKISTDRWIKLRSC